MNRNSTRFSGGIGLAALVACLVGVPHIARAADDEQFDVTSSIHVLLPVMLDGSADPPPPHDPATLNGLEPYKSGVIRHQDAANLIKILCQQGESEAKPPAPARIAPATPATAAQEPCAARATIIHILRWGDEGHKTVAWQKWYVYEPDKTWFSFDVATPQRQFARAFIRGHKDLRLVYVHLNFDIGNPEESGKFTRSDQDIQNNAPREPVTLLHPVAYKVAVSKKSTQLATDFVSVLKALNLASVTKTASVRGGDGTPAGYFSVANFSSQFGTSEVTVTASLAEKKDKDAPAAAPTGLDTTRTSASASLASRTFVNAGRAWFGLSFSVPLKSYDDVNYQMTNGVLQPQTIARDNIYLTGNLYLPPVDPGFTKFRWLPHILAGVPIKGKPLQHTMAGLGFGLGWLEPFAAGVFNIEKVPDPDAPAKTKNKTSTKFIWGLNISVSSAVAALKK